MIIELNSDVSEADFSFDKDEKVRCPMSDKPLKMKDLIPVTFTPIKDGDNRSLITKDVSY